MITIDQLLESKYVHICLCCGKKFRSRNTKSKYCCMNCYRKDRHCTVVCELCGRKIHRLKRNCRYENNFCSQDCYRVWRSQHSTRKIYYCKMCGKAFNRIPVRIKDENNVFCGRKCASRYRLLPRGQDSRCLEYIYQLHGADWMTKMLVKRNKNTQLFYETKSIVLDAIQRWLVSEKTKRFLLGYCAKVVDGWLKTEQAQQHHTNETIRKFSDNLSTYIDDIYELSDTK